MAIRDPEDPYKYLMAIECDGTADLYAKRNKAAKAAH